MSASTDGKHLNRGYGNADYGAPNGEVVDADAVSNRCLFMAMERDYRLVDIVFQIEGSANVTTWGNGITVGTIGAPAKFATLTPHTTGGTAAADYSLNKANASDAIAAAWGTSGGAGGLRWAAGGDTEAERYIPKGTGIYLNHTGGGAGAGRIFVGVLCVPAEPMQNRVR